MSNTDIAPVDRNLDYREGWADGLRCGHEIITAFLDTEDPNVQGVLWGLEDAISDVDAYNQANQ